MKICLTGDSWGCGEWSEWKGIEYHESYGVIHKGIEQYIIDDGKHSVVNVSRGASSNIRALQRLKKVLRTQEFDLIFWFVTDPIRDVSVDAVFKPCYHENTDSNIHVDDLIEFQEEMSLAAYCIANSIGKKIHLIGGTHKIDVEQLNGFSNLQCYIPSLTEWLVPTYNHPYFWRSDWFLSVKDNVTLEVLDTLIEAGNKINYLREQQKELFFPDGQHPNRQAHKLLYEKIKKDFLIEN